ncbi:hypothetical protein ACTHQ8_03410 [Lysinibacillus odysseyi]|nr:hypothetical protein [Lysinibacillus odysseyi]
MYVEADQPFILNGNMAGKLPIFASVLHMHIEIFNSKKEGLHV